MFGAWRQNKSTLLLWERRDSTLTLCVREEQQLSQKMLLQQSQNVPKWHPWWPTSSGRQLKADALASQMQETLTFLTVIRLHNHKLAVLFSYIYLFAKHATCPLCVSGVKSVIILGFPVKCLLLGR